MRGVTVFFFFNFFFMKVRSGKDVRRLSVFNSFKFADEISISNINMSNHER